MPQWVFSETSDYTGRKEKRLELFIGAKKWGLKGESWIGVDRGIKRNYKAPRAGALQSEAPPNFPVKGIEAAPIVGK